MEQFFDFDVVPFWETVLRVALACVLGMAIGLDRDLKRKPIDFRAYMIIAASSCVIAILSQEVYADYQTTDQTVRLDFMRVIEGVLTGIGFLGAGVIIRSRDSDRVIGTATGASIWAAGGMGLTLGFGFYGLTLIAFLAVFATLWVLGLLMAQITGQADKGKK